MDRRTRCRGQSLRSAYFTPLGHGLSNLGIDPYGNLIADSDHRIGCLGRYEYRDFNHLVCVDVPKRPRCPRSWRQPDGRGNPIIDHARCRDWGHFAGYVVNLRHLYR